MAGALRKTMIYLGLAEDDERYGDYEQYDDEPAPAERPAREEPVREARAEERRAQVTPLKRGPMEGVAVEPVMTDLQRITTIHPRTYNEAKIIGESFREGTPVIMNLTDMDDSDAKRLVDFAAGLIFGLHGSIERVTNKVFLLSPANVEVAAEDKVRMAESGFFNQS
jgi:cell division inhibitor SepF